MTIGNCKICGKPAEGRKGKAFYCSAECVRQNDRNDTKKRHAKFSPERKLAHQLVAAAILSGKLMRRPCQICGAKFGSDAHHDDYAKPLEVRWLCRGCHKRHHVKFGPGKNAYATQGSTQ